MKSSYGHKRICLALALVLLALPSSKCFAAEIAPREYPIAPDVRTTLERTVSSDAISPDAERVYPHEVKKFARNGYGVWHYGPGMPHEKRLDLMPQAYAAASADHAARLLNFFAITDIHISDKESPCQAI